MTRVVVVGGGVMGSSAAWRLAARGHEVTLLEQFAPGHTEGSSHGTSRIFRLAYPQASYVDLAARALPLWRQVEEEGGQAVLTLTGAVDHGPADVVGELAATLERTGHRYERMTPAEAEKRWPAMRFDTSVLYHPSAGRVHADHAVEAFQSAARAHGADVRHGVRVGGITHRTDGRVEVVTEDEASIADAVVVAAGGWAPVVAGPLVPELPALRVTQEQPVHFPADDPLSWPSFIHHGGDPALEPGTPAGVIYGLGSVDGVKVGRHGVGPVADPDRRDRSIDPAAQRVVQDYAARWLPGVRADQPEATTCLYTLTDNEDFIVDRVGPLTLLAGFSGHGFKFAPVIGELAAGLVEGRPGPPQFRLGR